MKGQFLKRKAGVLTVASSVLGLVSNIKDAYELFENPGIIIFLLNIPYNIGHFAVFIFMCAVSMWILLEFIQIHFKLTEAIYNVIFFAGAIGFAILMISRGEYLGNFFESAAVDYIFKTLIGLEFRV